MIRWSKKAIPRKQFPIWLPSMLDVSIQNQYSFSFNINVVRVCKLYLTQCFISFRRTFCSASVSVQFYVERNTRLIAFVSTFVAVFCYIKKDGTYRSFIYSIIRRNNLCSSFILVSQTTFSHEQNYSRPNAK